MTKHTPGPWRVCRHGYESPYMAHSFIEDVDGSPVCGSWWPQGNEECAANAHLIAAAPELLEALRAVVFAIAPDHDYENIEGFFREPVSQALAAIAKAEGR